MCRNMSFIVYLFNRMCSAIKGTDDYKNRTNLQFIGSFICQTTSDQEEMQAHNNHGNFEATQCKMANNLPNQNEALSRVTLKP